MRANPRLRDLLNKTHLLVQSIILRNKLPFKSNCWYHEHLLTLEAIMLATRNIDSMLASFHASFEY